MKYWISTFLTVVCLCLSLSVTAGAPVQPQITVYFKDAAHKEQSFTALRSFDYAGRVKSVNFSFKVTCSNQLCNGYENDFNSYILGFRDAIVSNNFYTKEAECNNYTESCGGNEIFSVPQEQLETSLDSGSASEIMSSGNLADKWLDRAAAVGDIVSGAIDAGKTASEMRQTVTSQGQTSSVTFITIDGKLVGVGYLDGQNMAMLIIVKKITAFSFDYSVENVPVSYSQSVITSMASYGASMGFAVTSSMTCDSNGKCKITGTTKGK